MAAKTWWCCRPSVNSHAMLMLAAGLKVEWRQYSMGHNLSEPEVHDIAAWLGFHLELLPRESLGSTSANSSPNKLPGQFVAG